MFESLPGVELLHNSIISSQHSTPLISFTSIHISLGQPWLEELNIEARWLPWVRPPQLSEISMSQLLHHKLAPVSLTQHIKTKLNSTLFSFFLQNFRQYFIWILCLIENFLLRVKLVECMGRTETGGRMAQAWMLAPGSAQHQHSKATRWPSLVGGVPLLQPAPHQLSYQLVLTQLTFTTLVSS